MLCRQLSMGNGLRALEHPGVGTTGLARSLVRGKLLLQGPWTSSVQGKVLVATEKGKGPDHKRLAGQ